MLYKITTLHARDITGIYPDYRRNHKLYEVNIADITYPPDFRRQLSIISRIISFEYHKYHISI